MVEGGAVGLDDFGCVTVFVTGANFTTRTVLEAVGIFRVVVDLFIEVVFVSSAVVVDSNFDVDVDVDSTNVVSSFKQISIKENR